MRRPRRRRATLSKNAVARNGAQRVQPSPNTSNPAGHGLHRGGARHLRPTAQTLVQHRGIYRHKPLTQQASSRVIPGVCGPGAGTRGFHQLRRLLLALGESPGTPLLHLTNGVQAGPAAWSTQPPGRQPPTSPPNSDATLMSMPNSFSTSASDIIARSSARAFSCCTRAAPARPRNRSGVYPVVQIDRQTRADVGRRPR